MKKYFLLTLLSVAMMAQAQIYYLMPTAAENAPVENVYNVLPYEADTFGVEVSPERRAYNWFMDANGFDGAGYVTIKDLTEGLVTAADCKVLWVNIDRVGLSLGDFDAMFNDDVTAALRTYVEEGGNLYVTKQAARLASKIGRTDWWPNDYQSNAYFTVAGNDEWQICFHFCCDGNTEHQCYQYMENGQAQDGLEFVTRYPLVSGDGEGTTYSRTDNNCAWGDWRFYLGTIEGSEEPLYGGCDPLRRSTFEEHINGKVLGGWGHTRGLDYAGFIEFYPTDTYAGRVMAMGLAAYQWGEQNKSEYNVKNLTRGILEYLNPTVTTNRDEVELQNASKMIENGQLIILRDGVRYNALGAQL